MGVKTVIGNRLSVIGEAEPAPDSACPELVEGSPCLEVNCQGLAIPYSLYYPAPCVGCSQSMKRSGIAMTINMIPSAIIKNFTPAMVIR